MKQLNEVFNIRKENNSVPNPSVRCGEVDISSELYSVETYI